MNFLYSYSFESLLHDSYQFFTSSVLLVQMVEGHEVRLIYHKQLRASVLGLKTKYQIPSFWYLERIAHFSLSLLEIQRCEFICS